jgi:hypothetical protein
MSARPALYLWTEVLLLFAGVPLFILAIKDRGLMILTLWLGALLVWLMLRRYYVRAHADEWNWAGFRAGLKPVIYRFLALAPLITLATWLFVPDGFLSLPREKTQLWLQIMIFYPLLSVWPQEIIYRSFLYYRYNPLFPSKRAYIAASAITFSFMHIMFMNPVALIMTLAGGYLFASDFARHRSLGLACLEHALYGCLIFTVGLGQFFYSGAAWGQ